jgi:ABC-type multidrug transport system ATPase subunit
MEAERAVSGAPVAGAVLSARHIQKYAYDEDGRPTRGSSVLLLSDANLEVRTGEIHVLIGENGAGKTTLIKVLGGAIPHESGARSRCTVSFAGLGAQPRRGPPGSR